MKEKARDGVQWLDALLRGEWLAGSSFTVADIHLYCFLQEMGEKGQPIPEECMAVKAWMERVGARSSAERSLWRWSSAKEIAPAEMPRVS